MTDETDDSPPTSGFPPQKSEGSKVGGNDAAFESEDVAPSHRKTVSLKSTKVARTPNAKKRAKSQPIRSTTSPDRREGDTRSVKIEKKQAGKTRGAMNTGSAAFVFGSTVVAGTLFIALGSVVGLAIQWLGTAITVIGPLAAMLVFINIAKGRQARQSYADGFYYLGFTFTLIGLAVSFGLQGVFGDNFSSDQTLAVFSMSLTTTVVGLVVRTALSQESGAAIGDSAEVEEESRKFAQAAVAAMEETQEAFRAAGDRLKIQLESDLQGASTAFSEVLSAQFRSVNEIAKKEINEFASSLRRGSEALETLSETTSRTRMNLEKAEAVVERSGVRIDAQLSAFDENILDLTQTLLELQSKLKESTGTLQQQFIASGSNIFKSAQAGEETARSMAELSSSTSDIAEAIQGVEQSLGSLAERVRLADAQIADSLVAIRQAADRSSEKIEGTAGEAIGKLSSVIEQFSKTLEEARTGLGS